MTRPRRQAKYYPATDQVALHDAFESIAATILRLAK